jgi:hypothetical protein
MLSFKLKSWFDFKLKGELARRMSFQLQAKNSAFI